RLITDGESRNRSGAGIYVTCLWSLADQGNEGRSAPLSARELDDLWADLADADAGTAYRAGLRLIAAPKQATKLLAEQARSLSAPHERIARLVADLDADDFAVREKASAELARLGEGVKPCLQQALGRQPGPEVRQRLEKVMEQIRTAKAVNGGGELLRGV